MLLVHIYVFIFIRGTKPHKIVEFTGVLTTRDFWVDYDDDGNDDDKVAEVWEKCLPNVNNDRLFLKMIALHKYMKSRQLVYIS